MRYLAQSFDPGVRPSWDALPPGVRTFLVDVVGTIMNIGILGALVVLIGGLITWGVGAITSRPGVGAAGVKIVVVAIVVAVLCAGANGFITFFANKAPSIFA